MARLQYKKYELHREKCLEFSLHLQGMKYKIYVLTEKYFKYILS